MTHLGPSLRRAKVRERPGRRAAAALGASILLNALVFVLLARAGAFDVPPKSARVSLAPVNGSQWAANRAIRPDAGSVSRPVRPPPAEPPKAPTPPPPTSSPKGQVVDVAPSPDSTPPKDARFLSDRDNTVDKETRSRHAKAGYERTLATPQAPGVQSMPSPGQDGRSAKAIPGAEGARPAPPAAPKGPPKLALAPALDGDLAVGSSTAEDGARPQAPGVGEGGQLREGPANLLKMTPGTLARLAGGPAPDHLQGIEEGEGTYLNTRGWKYATYFNRIKQQVAAAWDPMTPLEARDPDRSMFGYKDRFTLLGVTLDDTGHVKNLVIEQTSGAEFLDRAAIAAFKTAQPFMNPPTGIVDPNGEIKFSFGFFLEVGRPGMRVYRAPIPAMP